MRSLAASKALLELGGAGGRIAHSSCNGTLLLLHRPSCMLAHTVRWQSSSKKKAAAAAPTSAKAPSAAEQRGGSTRSSAPTSGKGASSYKPPQQESSSRTGGQNNNGSGIEGDIVFSARGIGKTLPGGRVLLSNVNLNFQRGAKIGVLGLNGAGKSTFLKILAGIDAEFDGEVWRKEGMRLGFLAQEPVLDEAKSVHENIMDGLRDKTALLERYDAIANEMGDPEADLDALLEEQAAVQAQIDHFDCWNLAPTVAMAKQALRVAPDDARVTSLSGGERRRVALCRLLLEQPEVLFLDEPTNHLDAESVAWLERFLQSYKGTVLAITHDRYFLDNVAGWILEIDRGTAYPYQGNYSVWLQRKSTRLDLEKKHERKKQKAMEEELAWIRQGAKARQSKSKARVAAYDKNVEERTRTRSQDKFMSGQIVIPPAPRLGDIVVQVRGLSKSIIPGGGKGADAAVVGGDALASTAPKVLLSNVSFSIPRGAIVGVIGGNGAGKTTLLRMIAGELSPDSGSIEVGKTVRMGLVSQSRSELTADQRVLDVVGAGSDMVNMGDYEMPVRQYLAAFNLVGELQTKLVRSLSGGERNRVHLARALRVGSNLLMLDEPTNDLDVDTLRSLEEALEEFTGCAIIVSHDRFFLNRVCTHLLVFEGAGVVTWFEGNFSEYEAHVAASGRTSPLLLSQHAAATQTRQAAAIRM